jgi:hypothetical protein
VSVIRKSELLFIVFIIPSKKNIIFLFHFISFLISIFNFLNYR